MEQLTQLINALKIAIEARYSVSIAADDITINYSDGKPSDVSINNPSITTVAG